LQGRISSSSSSCCGGGGGVEEVNINTRKIFRPN
jgi:hypothetical protein